MAKGVKTGGRQKGSRNKKTALLEEKAKEGGLMPLDYALQVMRDESAEPERRDHMAGVAMPFLHARRAPEDKHGNVIGDTIIRTPLGDDD